MLFLLLNLWFYIRRVCFSIGQKIFSAMEVNQDSDPEFAEEYGIDDNVLDFKADEHAIVKPGGLGM